MMSGKDRIGQIIKACVTVVTLIALTSRFCIIKATLNNALRCTRGTHDAIGPAQLTNSLITLHLVDEICDVDLHGWTPVRDRGMGWRQYTPSSNATTLESKKSDKPMTMSCIWVVFEKQMVLRAKRFMRVRKVRGLRSIFWVLRLPGLCMSGSRCRV